MKKNNKPLLLGLIQSFLAVPAWLSIPYPARGEDIPPPVYSTLAEWKQAMFSREALADGTSDDKTSPAGDGIPNLLKYAANLDPFERSGNLTGITIENDHLILEYLHFPQKTDIAYIPEVIGDLKSGDWLSGEDFIETSIVDENDDGSQLMAAKDKELVSNHTKRFMRLKIVRINLDTDNDEMPDDWELKHFGDLDSDGSEWAEGIEGMTLLEALAQGRNPNNFYDGINAKVMQVSGDSQRVAPTIALDTPLEVVVLNAATEMPLANAPVTFQVAAGGGDFSGPSTLRTLDSPNRLAGPRKGSSNRSCGYFDQCRQSGN